MLQINNICCSIVNVNNSKINKIKSFSKKIGKTKYDSESNNKKFKRIWTKSHLSKAIDSIQNSSEKPNHQVNDHWKNLSTPETWLNDFCGQTPFGP